MLIIRRIEIENANGIINNRLSDVSLPSETTRKMEKVRPKIAGNDDLNFTKLKSDV